MLDGPQAPITLNVSQKIRYGQLKARFSGTLTLRDDGHPIFSWITPAGGGSMTSDLSTGETVFTPFNLPLSLAD